MSTVTKFEMDEKLSKMNNFMMSFMDYTNNKMKLMEEEIKQHKDKIGILEKELNQTKTNNQEYKHKIYILENDLIYGINRKLEVIDDRLDEIDGKIDETVDELDEIDRQIDKKLEVIVNNIDNRFNNKIVDINKNINTKTNVMNTKPTKIYNKKQVITSVINKIMTDNNKKYVVINDGLNKFDKKLNKKYNILVGRFHKIHELIVEIDKNSCKNKNDIVKELNIISKNYNTLLGFVNKINKPQQTTSSSNDESNGLVKCEYDGVVYFKTPDNLLYNEKKDLMGKINSNNDVVFYCEEDYDSDESEDSYEEDD